MTNPGTSGESHTEIKRWRWSHWLLVTLFIAVLAVGATLGVWVYKAQRITQRIETHVASQPYEGFAIGDLGGMPVKIPRYMAEMLEYDGDPGWAPAPDWRPPVRTFDSKMNSFGFYVRFPDGATLDSRERREEKRLVAPWEDTWISVVVRSSSGYPGDDFLESYEQAIRKDQNHPSALFRYRLQPEKLHGLELHQLAPHPEGPDPEKTLVYDQLFARDRNGRLLARFFCTAVRADANRSTCTQVWSLQDQGLKVKLSAQYRRPMLEHWQTTQSMVTRIVLGFSSKTGPETQSMTTR